MMTFDQLHDLLQSRASKAVQFVLPDGGRVPAHAHVTEVGRIDKRFIDCGGTRRAESHCLLQTWVAEDFDHRLHADKLAMILAMSRDLIEDGSLPVRIEYEDELISQFPVVEATEDEATLYLHTAMRHTDCLAKDVCLPGGGCC